MDTVSKPHWLKAIGLAVLHSLNLHIAFNVLIIAIVLVTYILSLIPILRSLLGIFLEFLENRGDGFGIFVPYISLSISYFSSKALLNRITKHAPTLRLSLCISGIVVTASHIMFLVVNVFFNGAGSWRTNLGFIILGLVVYCSHYKLVEKPRQEATP